MDIPWNLACLYGALVMATGPTVITPIIRNLNLNYRLRKLLEFEGVFNDAFSVILSALMFEWILSGVSTGAGALSFILQRIFFGAMIGIACGTVLYLLYTRLKTVSNQTVRYVTLTMILVCYATAEVLGTESGILAVALFGMILGSTNIPYQSMIKEFKNDIVVFMISLIFVLLAAMIEFDHILTTGIYGLVIVGCIIGVIRPLAVRIALRNSKFNENEKMFVSFIGPKGVVPVSMSVYFALRMSDLGITGGETLVGLMFITVIISVTICGGLSSYVANRFEVIPMSTIIINGDKIGILLADKIHQRGNNVTVLDENSDRCKILEDSGIHAICGDIMDKNILIDMNFDKCQHVIVNTGRDDTNHFICKLLQMHTSISNDKIIVRINDSENNEIFEKMGTRIMNKDVATATILDNMIT
jgi:NhaP-type Na+/H+ or K+/H+ antiporter